ncbi:MAG TPA: peptidase MA family metallohydrolase [Tepidiformaceae bacterium]|jgi:hypothetical protein
MTRSLLVLALLALAGLGSIVSAPLARAQATIESATVENEYPRQLRFKLTASAPVDIVDVTLNYRIPGRGTSALGKPSEITPAKNLSTEVVVQVNSGSSYIPVGSEFHWQWQIETADGEVTLGPEETFFFMPPGKDWKFVDNDFMVVYYHGDRENLATQYLKSGEDTYQRIGKDLLGVELTQLPVRVILFEDAEELAEARPGRGTTFDAAVTTCGTKVTNDIVLVIPVSCGTPDRTDTLRHEFGHIINEAAGDGPLASLPSWLDEGTAVIAQSTPGNNYTGAFEAAARSNRLIPFAQMVSPSNEAGQVNLFYGQAYAMTLYLIEKGGPEQFAEFFATIKSGTRFDAAIEQIYGLTIPEFEAEFLEAVGAQPSARPTAAPTARPQQQQPTPAPTRPSTSQSNSDDDGIDRVMVAIIGLSVLFALIAVFMYLFSTMLAANRRNAAQDEAGAHEPPDFGDPPA